MRIRRSKGNYKKIPKLHIGTLYGIRREVVKAGNSFVLKTTKVEFPSTIKHIEVK